MKKCICDIETDGVENCKHIWCCVCRDVDTDVITIFREGDDGKAREFLEIMIGLLVITLFLLIDFGLRNFGMLISLLIMSLILWYWLG